MVSAGRALDCRTLSGHNGPFPVVGTCCSDAGVLDPRCRVGMGSRGPGAASPAETRLGGPWSRGCWLPLNSLLTQPLGLPLKNNLREGPTQPGFSFRGGSGGRRGRERGVEEKWKVRESKTRQGKKDQCLIASRWELRL